MRKRWAFLENDGPLAFAHRGGAGEAPENTLAAFRRAVELGFRYLETDVRVSSDGVAMAFHDATLDRVTNLTGRFCDLSRDELREALVWGREPIPTLEELLRTFPKARFNIDPKEDAGVKPLAEVIARTGAIDRVCVGSFAGRRLTKLREMLGPRLCHSVGLAALSRLRLVSLGSNKGISPPEVADCPCVQLPPYLGGHRLVDERLVKAAHAESIQVHVWVVNEPEEMHRLLNLGVDGIMTDFPSVLREVLRERGAWPVR